MSKLEIKELIMLYETAIESESAELSELGDNTTITDEDGTEINLIDELAYVIECHNRLKDIATGKRQFTQGMGADYYRGVLDTFIEWMSKAK